MRRSNILPALLLAALLAPAEARAGKPEADAGKPEAGISWLDWNAGVKKAGNADRPVLVDVYTDWCGWCKRMDRDVYAREDVRAYLSKHYVTVKLNAEANTPARYEGKPYTARTLAASRFRVSGYPTTLFLRADGSHIVNVPGYVPADNFLLLLRYVGEGHIDRGVTYDDFVKQAAGH